MNDPTPSLSVYWGQQKQIIWPWLEFRWAQLFTPRTLTVKLVEHEIRCTVAAGSSFPLADMLKDIRLRQIYGIFDRPGEGFHVRVYRILKTKEGEQEEEL